MKRVTLNKFMNDELTVLIPITLAMPSNYVHADIEVPPTYSYWMPSDKIPMARKGQDLPTDTGWLYGNISLSVGYDQSTAEFFGDGGLTVDQILTASGCEAVESERTTVNGYPVLFLKVKEKQTGKTFYTIYIGMLLETNNIFIAYRPPLDNPQLGFYVWANLKKCIKESNMVLGPTL